METLTPEEIYKGFLKDGDKTIYLSSFVNQAESFNSKSSNVDIVKGYLLLSGNGREILQLIKAIPTLDLQIVTLIMKTLCHILLRVVNDLNAFMSIGTSITNEFLTHGTRTVFNFLKIKKRSSRTKLALHLLSSMIALGGQAAHQVVSKLDFSNIIFTQLFGRRTFLEEDDVRTTFINMIILIMTTCDFAVIRKLVEVKGFLNDILAGLESDRPHLIILVLSTFQKLIVESTEITKTTKLKLFNDYSLKSVMKLYSWKGPVRNKFQRKRKLGEEEVPIAYGVSEEEIANVQSCAHEFMLSLCCSFKYGIIFHDTSIGTSGKNYNQVLTNILVRLPKPHTNKLVAELVIEVLKICPDQMVHYLPYLKSSCTPRFSALWVNAISVMKKIILSQDLVSCLFKHGEKKLVSVLVNIAKVICFPCVLTSSEISNAFKGAHPSICYHLCDYLICILNKIKSVAEFCVQADLTKIPYSAADISAFNQSFLTTIFQNFTFMQDIENLWDKLTLSEKHATKEQLPKDEIEKGIPLPSHSEQLNKILEVMQHFLMTSHYGYHHEYEVNVPKLFQSLKNSHSLLTHEELCKLNIRIVDIIAAQEEEAVTLWTKSLIDSPLMVLLDVYMTFPSENMIDDVSQILYKVLVHTKVFEFCPWETAIWLESMKSSKAKHIPFIIEFINSTVCYLLQNPNVFSDDIIETTFGKNSSKVTLDVISTLNDLLLIDKDPIVIENFEASTNISSVPKLCFSSLVPAALFTLNSLDCHKLKGCQPYVEKVLYHIMHHQQSPQSLFHIIQKYRNSISSNMYNYFELLCLGKNAEKITMKSETCKAKDLSEHLQMKFITLHTQDISAGCLCDIPYEPQNLRDEHKEKIIWQLMTYIDWEISMFLEDKIQNSGISNYMSLLENLLDLSDVIHHSEKAMEIELQQVNSAKCKVFEHILNRSSVLRCFLWVEKVHKSKRTFIKEYLNEITKLTLKIIPKVISNEDSHEYLAGLKKKVIKFCSYHFENVNLPKNFVIVENPEICDIINIFSTVYSNKDVTYMLEDLLNMETRNIKIENHFSALSLVFKLYLELKDFMMLSPKAVSSLFVKYTEMTKKQKKTVKDYITHLFEKHPILASVVNVDSCLLLLKQPASKNFYILGCLIDCNKVLKYSIQTAIIENLNELMSTPDFIYLVSKCILNFSINEAQDVEFLDKVSTLFWEKVTEYIIIDVASADKLLESCAAGKAVQILCKYNKLTEKNVYKFFKNYSNTLNATTPNSSKMLIFLQFMEVLKINSPESSKFMSILKLAIHWLTCIMSSFQSVSEFNYFPLICFIHSSLQHVPEVNMSKIVEAETFFQKILKVAMKHKAIGHQLIDILVLLIQKSQNYEIPTQLLFNLVSGHSNFFNIMLSQIKENNVWRESVVDLLITLVSRDKSVCQDNHLGLILSSYTGSLKSVDRKLLYLIKLYSESDIDMTKFSPFLWSKTAVVHYSVMNSETMHLWKKPKQQELLSIFSSEMLEVTVEKYPLSLKLEPSLSDPEDAFKTISDISELDKIYDLRFFLPLFANMLSPGSFVYCRTFMDSKVLMLIFTSLSSFDPNTRALGYYCLSQLYFHLEGANYGEKDIWLCLLDSLRNSITTDNPRIPSIVTLFLAKVTHIFTRPDHPLFTMLYRFICVKPNLDIGQVPEFYKLFNSLDIEHRVQRMWLLKLLSNGLRSSLDFHICEKRYIFNLLLTYFWSSVSSPQEKIVILDIVSSAVKIDVSARILGQNALLSWLHNVTEATNSTDVTIIKNLSNLLKNFWLTTKKFCRTEDNPKEDLEDADAKIKELHETFPVEFFVVILSFSKKLKALDAASLKSYLLTLYDVTTFIKNSKWNIHISLNLSVHHISEILESFSSISVKQEMNENKNYPPKSESHNSSLQELTELILRIILLWSPNWKSNNELYYSKQQLCVLKSVQLMSQIHNLSSVYGTELPTWLYKCFKEDKSHGLVKLFLSSENESCLRLILDFYEKSLTFSNELININNDKLLHFEAQETIAHQWRKILSFFKKVCKNCNLTSDLNLFNQISIIL